MSFAKYPIHKNSVYFRVAGQRYALSMYLIPGFLFFKFSSLCYCLQLLLKKEKRQINSPLHEEMIVQYPEVMPLSQQLHHTEQKSQNRSKPIIPLNRSTTFLMLILVHRHYMKCSILAKLCIGNLVDTIISLLSHFCFNLFNID